MCRHQREAEQGSVASRSHSNAILVNYEISLIFTLTCSRDINVAAQRKRRRLKSWTVNVLFLLRISSKESESLDFSALISVEGADCGGNVASLSTPRYLHER